jgi:glycosyltransferase involved in cell wall biosynthesis
LNILFLSQENPYPPDGGHYIRTYNVLKLLAERHKIYFVATADNDWRSQNKSGLEELCETVDIFIPGHRAARLKFFWSLFLNLFSPLPFSVSKNFSKKVSTRITRLIAEKNIDLVHVDILPLAYYYQDFKDLPKILVNHNVESLRLFRWMKIEKNIFKKIYLYLQYRKLSHFEKTICPQFDRCIVVSEEDKKLLQELCSSNNFVILPNGVDTQYYQGQNHRKVVENSMIWVGGMRFAYNGDAVDYFLEEIFPLLREKIPQIKISFIGNFPTSKLLKYSKNYKNLIVHGFVDDIRPQMMEAAVFFAPIRIGSGTKLKVLNAMALEKAVITTTIGAEGIDAAPGIDLMIADTPQDFAAKTIYLLQHPEEASQMGKRGRKVIEKYYDWQAIGKTMQRIYDEVAKGKIPAN